MKWPWQKLTQEEVDRAFEDKSLPGDYDDQYVLLQKINKVYSNKFHAVHDFSLCIKKKEFVVFVGPSGCGKSTTLRMSSRCGARKATATYIVVIVRCSSTPLCPSVLPTSRSTRST